jgi:hypothetical protein
MRYELAGCATLPPAGGGETLHLGVRPFDIGELNRVG